MKYRIIELESKYYSKLEKLIRDCLIEYGANHDGTAWADPFLGRLSEVYIDEKNKYWIAVDENDDVISGVGIGEMNGIDNICELQKMYTKKEFRGFGISKEILDIALNHSKKYYKEIYLETLDNMNEAIRFYEKNGFQRTDKVYGNTGHFACDVRFIRKL